MLPEGALMESATETKTAGPGDRRGQGEKVR